MSSSSEEKGKRKRAKPTAYSAAIAELRRLDAAVTKRRAANGLISVSNRGTHAYSQPLQSMAMPFMSLNYWNPLMIQQFSTMNPSSLPQTSLPLNMSSSTDETGKCKRAKKTNYRIAIVELRKKIQALHNSVGDRGTHSYAKPLQSTTMPFTSLNGWNHYPIINQYQQFTAWNQSPLPRTFNAKKDSAGMTIKAKNREIKDRDKQIALYRNEIDRKNIEIDSLRLKNAIDTVELTNHNEANVSDGNEPPAKRSRTEETTTKKKSTLAIIHESNQKLVKVKLEKVEAEAKLVTATEENEALKSDLKDAREDLEDEQELVKQQILATDVWQARFDELVALVGDNVDKVAVAEIRGRSMAQGR